MSVKLKGDSIFEGKENIKSIIDLPLEKGENTEKSLMFTGSNSTIANNCLAFGNNNTITAASSYAFGASNELASTGTMAIGGKNKTTSSGTCDFLVGANNTIDGTGYSQAFGQHHEVSGTRSFAQGLYGFVPGDYSRAMGHMNKASGMYSIASGAFTWAAAKGSVALIGDWAESVYLTGEANATIFTYSHEDNPDSWDNELFNVCFIQGNILRTSAKQSTSGDKMVVKLTNIVAIDKENHTIELDRPISDLAVENCECRLPCTASLYNYGIAIRGAACSNTAVSVGRSNIAYGWTSVALGQASRARADMSFTFGEHTESTNYCEVSFGSYNNSRPGTKFSIGDGDSNQNRKNMMMINNSGQMYLRGVGGYQGNEIDLSNIQSVNAVVNAKSQIVYLNAYFITGEGEDEPAIYDHGDVTKAKLDEIINAGNIPYLNVYVRNSESEEYEHFAVSVFDGIFEGGLYSFRTGYQGISDVSIIFLFGDDDHFDGNLSFFSLSHYRSY